MGMKNRKGEIREWFILSVRPLGLLKMRPLPHVVGRARLVELDGSLGLTRAGV